MDKFKFLFHTALIVALTLITGCNGHKSGNDLFKPSDIEGIWSTLIRDGEFSGKQDMIFSNDLSYKEIKQLLFSSSDSGFDFSIRCNVTTGGKWRLSKDSILICYDCTVNVEPIKQSFQIVTVKAASKPLNIETKNEMAADIENFLIDGITRQIKSVSYNYYPLGRVVAIRKDTMTLEQGDNIIHLTRGLNQTREF